MLCLSGFELYSCWVPLAIHWFHLFLFLPHLTVHENGLFLPMFICRNLGAAASFWADILPRVLAN